MSKPPSARIGFVDTLRGFAVLLMLTWHTLEGWLRPELADGPGYRALRLVAGTGSALFILLAGAAVALRLAADARRGVPREQTVRCLVSRGILLIFLGYALRLQFWLVDSTAILRPESAMAWVPAGLGLWASVIGLARFEREGLVPSLRWLVPGTVGFAGGLLLVGAVAPSRLDGVLRVDVLQCIGASLVAIALVAGPLRASTRGALGVAMAIVIPSCTPLVGALAAGTPEWASGYLADTATWDAAFPLFPFAAYAWAGLALGVLWDHSAREGRLTQAVVFLAIAGIALAVLTSESLPHGYRWTQELPLLVQPFRIAHRVGLIMAWAAPAAFIAERAIALRRFGQASLVVYWIHLTFAFGFASRAAHHQLGWQEWLGWLLLLTVAMYGVARFRLGPYETWRSHARHLSAKRALL